MMSEFHYLPTCSGLYFAIEEGNQIAYIGQSHNIYQRWRTHNMERELCDLSSLESARRVRIAWMEVSDVDSLPQLERVMIRRFRPRLNIMLNGDGKPAIPNAPRMRISKPAKRGMLTTREVAERLNANPGSIRYWCITGIFRNAIHQETPRGPVWLIPETNLDGFIRRKPGRPKGSKAKKTAKKTI